MINIPQIARSIAMPVSSLMWDALCRISLHPMARPLQQMDHLLSLYRLVGSHLASFYVLATPLLCSSALHCTFCALRCHSALCVPCTVSPALG